MSSTTGSLLVAGWLVGVGLVAVYLEVRAVQCGLEIHRLLKKEEAAVERLREAELRYNQLLSPDELEAGLPEQFRDPEQDYEASSSAAPRRETEIRQTGTRDAAEDLEPW